MTDFDFSLFKKYQYCDNPECPCYGNARVIRKTLCFSKKACFHDAHIRFLTQVFNYTRTVDNLKIVINQDAKRFQQKFLHRTPAMAEKIINRVYRSKNFLSLDFQQPILKDS